MGKIPLIAAVNDMSGFGRCSLTVALPVISAMGMQCCPLPTAILSNHTGYNSCHFTDLSHGMDEYISEWGKLQLKFDGVYTGFLANASQVDKVMDFVSNFAKPGVVKLIDPVMADNGELYSTCDAELCKEMAKLVSLGTITTPNLTEACLLTGRNIADVLSLNGNTRREAVYGIAESIAKTGPKQVVVTGVEIAEGMVENVVYDNGERFSVSSPKVERQFAGTGDLFASVLCGHLVRGGSLKNALGLTTAFVYETTQYTFECDSPATDGIMFEPFLNKLCK